MGTLCTFINPFSAWLGLRDQSCGTLGKAGGGEGMEGRGVFVTGWVKTRMIEEIVSGRPITPCKQELTWYVQYDWIFVEKNTVSGGGGKLDDNLWMVALQLIFFFLTFLNFPKFLQWPCITIKNNLKERKKPTLPGIWSLFPKRPNL